MTAARPIRSRCPKIRSADVDRSDDGKKQAGEEPGVLPLFLCSGDIEKKRPASGAVPQWKRSEIQGDQDAQHDDNDSESCAQPDQRFLVDFALPRRGSCRRFPLGRRAHGNPPSFLSLASLDECLTCRSTLIVNGSRAKSQTVGGIGGRKRQAEGERGRRNGTGSEARETGNGDARIGEAQAARHGGFRLPADRRALLFFFDGKR